ncbi:MAG: 2-oxo acid dehydrogenase subunit E2 [Candidatus Cloacimonetes bacterium]|nr:2-oxo acid dehydrogenase subunit E2 [Candidatus Cloacimonadota bacterium]
MATEIPLPELGENITAGELVNVLVAVGDRVTADDPIVEIETDKAVIEVPAGKAGTVTEILVKAGERVPVGQTLLRLDTGDALAAKDKAAEAPPEKPAETPAVEAAAEKPATPRSTETEVPASQKESAETAEEFVPDPEATPARALAAPAAPSVRREARELGVDIHAVQGSGVGGRISIDDVRRHVKSLNEGRTHRPASSGVVGDLPWHADLPDLSRFGNVTPQPMSNVRRATAQHMAATWNTVPQVTQYDKADITELETLRVKLAPRVEKAGGKLTMTGILLKVAAAALRRHPQFNVAVDMAGERILERENVHIGVAVDTPRGLLVPVIRDADSKNITRLSVELGELSAKARERKAGPEELTGGSFTISNLGGIGGVGFSPIVNWPEVAILGVSRGEIEPRWDGTGFVPRRMLPLSLSYDHRVIDGADAARFLRWICEALEQPLLLALEG